MRYLTLFLLLFLSPLGVSFSYDLNSQDERLIQNINEKIDNITDEKPSILSDIIIRLEKATIGQDKDTRIGSIFAELLTHSYERLVDFRDDNRLAKKQGLKNDQLKTNTALRSISLESILDGGPGKDGIPALDLPVFESIADTDFLRDDSRGIALSLGSTNRFYSFNILNWHEIVNDTIEGKAVAVTFCPLCGTSLVFDRMLDGEILNFGVSGKLHQSNLLMFDRDSETLRSQTLGKAVVGDKLGKMLSIIDSDVMSFAEFSSMYPDGEVLSDETGYERHYSVDSPYGDYDDNNLLVFPVDNEDVRLHKKEILYVVNHDGYSVAFLRKALVAAGEASLTIGDRHYVASYDSGKIDVDYNGKALDGFHEMRFSRANKHPASSSLRTGE